MLPHEPTAGQFPPFAATFPKTPPDPAWLAMCKRQPALLDLEREAASGVEPGYLVPRLEMLVGWYCDDPKLKNRRAFDMAFDALGRAYALKRALAAEVMEGRSK